MPPQIGEEERAAVWREVESGIDKLADGSSIKWKHDRSGNFSVKSAYNLLSHADTGSDSSWEKIWKLKVPQRCRTLMWLAARKCLLTNATRRRRGLSEEDCCPICNQAVEDTIHVFRDCHESRRLWKRLVPSDAWRRFCSLNFDEWFWWNTSIEKWKALFAVICWWLWRRRNLFIFERKRVSNEAIIANANAIIANIDKMQQQLAGVKLQGVRRCNDEGKWHPPDDGWVKLNVDGAYSPYTTSSACGGLIRNEAGEFLQGFIQKLGDDGDALTAELWACLQGLKTAWDNGHRRVILESDASNAIEMLNAEPDERHADYNILKEVRVLINRDWNVRINHVSREYNKAADFLAKKGLEAVRGYHFVSAPPLDLANILSSECNLDIHKDVVR